jgi:hypothetical protein
VTVATGGAPTALVEAQPVTMMTHAALHPTIGAETHLLAVLIRPPSSGDHATQLWARTDHSLSARLLSYTTALAAGHGMGGTATEGLRSPG